MREFSCFLLPCGFGRGFGREGRSEELHVYILAYHIKALSHDMMKDLDLKEEYGGDEGMGCKRFD